MSGDISVVVTQEQTSALAEQIKQSVTTAQLAGALQSVVPAAGNAASGAVRRKT
ncbi:hypothetical protein [Burkholderia ubonensis]|uniref:hypothetical protein n=1 Tax=Burkholderia ubonensis TaxID=101571 RepID=UPI000AA657CF|nr:hypothetical protein [Burkholderia ubonensis]